MGIFVAIIFCVRLLVALMAFFCKSGSEHSSPASSCFGDHALRMNNNRLTNLISIL
jgi:hypothetical protein